MSVTTDKLLPALNMLQQAPKLIITDSQVFDYVYQNKPAESMLTSFLCCLPHTKGICRTIWKVPDRSMQ